MKTFAFLGALLALWVVAVGCGQSPTNSISSDSEKTSTAHSHESWWCREHGVPEEICARMSSEGRQAIQSQGRLVPAARPSRIAMLHLSPGTRVEVRNPVRS